MDIISIFKERYAHLTDDASAFTASLQQQVPKSFRVNTLKSTSSEIIENFGRYDVAIEQVGWYNDAFICDARASASIEHALGMIYFQELTSMLPPTIIADELTSAQLVIDACAAPGSKTTHCAALMKNSGTIIANDINYSRLRALRFNIEKCGCFNVVLTNKDFLRFHEICADAIILDAPCSSEGMIRKKHGILERWSLNCIATCAALQKKLIVKAFDSLVDGGTLIYSTCTFAPEENEAVLNYLLSQREAKLEHVELAMNHSSGIESWGHETFCSDVKKAVRIWPHQNNTGGFFFAKVRK